MFRFCFIFSATSVFLGVTLLQSEEGANSESPHKKRLTRKDHPREPDIFAQPAERGRGFQLICFGAPSEVPSSRAIARLASANFRFPVTHDLNVRSFTVGMC